MLSLFHSAFEFSNSKHYGYHKYPLFFFVGSENVQAAQKFITGLDARRIAKFPEHRYILSQAFDSLEFVVSATCHKESQMVDFS